MGEKRKAMILKGLEDHIAGLAEEAVKDSGEGSDSATAEEGDDSAAYTPSPPPPPPSAPEVDKIVVTFKYTDEERTLPVTKYVGEMKMVISLELGIPMKHQHLRNPDTDQIMKDHEVSIITKMLSSSAHCSVQCGVNFSLTTLFKMSTRMKCLLFGGAYASVLVRAAIRKVDQSTVNSMKKQGKE